MCIRDSVDSSQDITEIIEENVDTNDDENEKIIIDNDADSNQQQTIEANGEDEDVPNEEELKKLNSFSMLCYLAIISEQIQSSKDNRVMPVSYTHLKFLRNSFALISKNSQYSS